MTIKIGDKEFTSRLMVGTGKFDDFETMKKAHAASGAEIVTVAIRRVDENFKGHVGLMDNIDLNKYWLLPNTAGCATAEEAIRVARLSRAMGINNWIKLEVIPDPKFLLPDPIATLEAAKVLVDEGFTVLPYINADPILSKATLKPASSRRTTASRTPRPRTSGTAPAGVAPGRVMTAARSMSMKSWMLRERSSRKVA